jgi:hypothetical protein
MIQWQIGSMLGMSVGPRPKADASAQANYAQPVYAAQTQQTVPAIQGTLVPGATLAEKFAWLQRSADSHNTYVLEVSADENIAPHTFYYEGAINITIVLRGIGGNRAIRLKSNGTMFTVRSNVTLILDNNITLYGHNGNSGRIVSVEGGTLKMNVGSTITGNASGGVGVSSGGIFEMKGGIISGNTANSGGGVYVREGTFTISGGTISENTAKQYGGGVHFRWGFNNNGPFTMSGGTISGNIALVGGGVYMPNANFTMSGGVIISNIAREYGGGVYAEMWNFTKIGGTITGYNSDQSNGNVVMDEAGNVIARRGHTVYAKPGWGRGDVRKETTAGPEVKLSSTTTGCSGAWDQ